MNISAYPILSIITFIPLAGAMILLLVPSTNRRLISIIATTTAAVVFIISIGLWCGFDMNASGYQFVEKVSWIPSLGIHYFVGLDGLTLLMILLTTFLSLIAVVSSYKAISERYREYMIALLILQTGMTGVFIAVDMFLFYIYWEVILIPMYLLIGIWGGKNRLNATMKFFIYTLAGSTLMLIAIIYMAYQVKLSGGRLGFSLLDFQTLNLDPHIQTNLFLAFALAFAIKVPLFPFHTWLPDAHTEAPTAGSIILAGILLKMGTYGFIRFNLSLFPETSMSMAPWICGISVVGIIYGALMALVQPDVKRLVAYSSVSHLGFVMLGLFSLNETGITGGLIQMINHGISTGMLFLLVGMIYERRHSRLIEDFGGIAKVMPIYAVFMMIATLSSIGLPGTNGFVGEILIMTGGFMYNPVFGIIAASGVILGAVYMLRMYQKVFLGELKNSENKILKDLSLREISMLAPLTALIFWIGVMPGNFTSTFTKPVQDIVAKFHPNLISPALPPETGTLNPSKTKTGGTENKIKNGKPL